MKFDIENDVKMICECNKKTKFGLIDCAFSKNCLNGIHRNCECGPNTHICNN